MYPLLSSSFMKMQASFNRLCVSSGLRATESPQEVLGPQLISIDSAGVTDSVAGKVLALQGQGPEFEPLEHT